MFRRDIFNAMASFSFGLWLIGPATGADLGAAKAPAPPPLSPPPAFTWTGLYVGFNTGYTWTASDPIALSTVNLFDTSGGGFGPASAAGASGVVNARLDGFFFGGQAGYNWQFAERLIVGLEADIQGAGVRGGGGQLSIYDAPAGQVGTSFKLNRNLEFLGTARGRLGYAVTPTLMAYVTGGLAYGGANLAAAMSQNLSPTTLLSDTVRRDHFDILTGWTVGAGAEMALTRNLSGRLEYLYYDLGQLWMASPSLRHENLPSRETLVFDATGANARYSGHVLRAGLNYRFDPSIPQTAGSAASPLFASSQVVPLERPRYGGWSFVVTPYLWSINLNGAMILRGESLAADATFVDALTKSSAFPLAFMGRVEAENGPFWAYGDAAWTRLRFAGSAFSLRSPVADLAVSASVSGRLKMSLGIGEAGFGYELGRWKFSNAPGSFTAIDAYTGLRYVNLGVDVSADAVVAAGSQLLDLQQFGGKSLLKTGTMWWMDPVVGLRLRQGLGPGSRFEMRGDIGGFGAGSKFSWQCYGGYNADFDYNGMRLTALVGYRALGMDFSKWVNGRENGVNAIVHGPVTGLGMRF
jgi:opacity protein-like surface antigen